MALCRCVRVGPCRGDCLTAGWPGKTWTWAVQHFFAYLGTVGLFDSGSISPGNVPGSSDNVRYLQAVRGLERVGKYKEALEGGPAALEKWPDNRSALLGQANFLYSLRQLQIAEAVLRNTVELYPSYAPAWNNLAQVLLEQGQEEKALDTVRQVLELDGEHQEHYQQTLKCISRD